MLIMHRRFSTQLLYLLISVLLLHMKPGTRFISAAEGAKLRCIERERQALLKFKNELEDEYSSLSSWGSEEEKSDCCKWRGVGCSNRTGHITLLHLQDVNLGGNISDSLLELQHLNYLNLSNNGFYSRFPSFVGSLRKLRYLGLASNGLIGTLSYQLGNLSSLQSLDLSDNYGVSFENLHWLSRLSSLEHLDLSGNNLTNARDWMQVVNNLPRLKELQLTECSLLSIGPPALSSINASKSLAILDLSSNNLSTSIFSWLSIFNYNLVELDLSATQLEGSIPDVFGNLTSLTSLRISYNGLEGGIPRSFGAMCSLRELDLSFNNLSGPLPRSFRNMHGCLQHSLQTLKLILNRLHGSLPDFTRFSSMTELDLSENQLNGSLPKRLTRRSKLVSLRLQGNRLRGSLPDVTLLPSLEELWISDNRLDGNVPESIGSLSELNTLLADGNSLTGVISEAHFSNLSKLEVLDLSGSSYLALKFRSDWVPPFQLITIYLSSCELGPYYPKWLQTQNKFSILDISGAGISDTIPNWFWDLSDSYLGILNLARNNLRGTFPDFSSKYPVIYYVDLSFNQFEGPLPTFPSGTVFLDLSNNLFSGHTSAICRFDFLMMSLDLSNNLLPGQLPNCFIPLSRLLVLNLANNNFSGSIPESFGSLPELETLSLRNNSFSGELPSALQNCNGLIFLDLSENKLQGEIPAWIGGSLLSLKFLSLASNEFYGIIPSHLCQLSNIQILDLSLNNISGLIPKCLNNYTAMVQKGNLTDIVSVSFATDEAPSYVNKAWVEWKGRRYEHKQNLGLLRIIDFSGNNLTGEIPEEVTSLVQLVALNLSGNNLRGVIPLKIGQLKELESLDFSENQLSGVIPPSMASLNFLNYLNLSYNNLSGKIPSGTQLQGFNASAFAGNLALCGLPVQQKCPGDETTQRAPANDDNQGNEADDEFVRWFYTAMGIGFGVFFWAVSASLLLKRSWRHAYFRFLDEAWDWIYVKIVVQNARLQQKFQRFLS